MTLASLVDEYLYEVARLYTPATERKYSQVLDFLLRDCGDKTPIEAITEGDILRCLIRWKDKSKATQALHISIFKGCFAYAVEKGHLEGNPVQRIKRPRLPRLEDRKVVIVSTHDVQKMFQFCRDWGDEICLGILAYTGARRNAVSMIRWRDVSLTPDPPHGPHGWITMEEKGGKFTDKPIPFFLREIIDRAPEHEPSDYLVPNKRPAAVKRKERSNDIIYDRVKDIAKRAGVEAHVHALRAAFAVFFLENHRGTINSLQKLLGHESIETTRHYTRGLNRKQQMAEVLNLDWGSSPQVNEIMREVESALSEAEHLPRDSSREGRLDERRGSASLSALSEEGAVKGKDKVGTVRTLHSSVLPNGQESNHSMSSSAPIPSSESALTRHEEGHERLAAHHVFPGKAQKAHTGFEPVNPFLAWVHAHLAVIRHLPGHRIGHYPSV